MVQFAELVKRNMRIYLRDRSAVFFSLLSMLIVILLMVFFLGDMNINAVTGLLEMLPDRDTDVDKTNAELLVLEWTCAGIISINAVTVTLSALSSMIKDREAGRLNSILTAPVSHAAISAAYVCSAWICSVIVCAATLAVTELYCVMQGAQMFDLPTHAKLLGMIAVNSFTYSSLMYLIALIAKTEGAWSGLGTIVGTLVGFLGGIYLPIGSLSEGIGNVLKSIPVLYGTVMFRNVMTDEIVSSTFDGAPEEMISEYRTAMGIDMEFLDNEITNGTCIAVLAISGMVFLLAGILVTKYSKRSDR